MKKFSLSSLVLLSFFTFGCIEGGDQEVRRVQFLEFYADWCGPCKKQKPIVEKLESAYPEVDFRYINIDQQPDFAGSYRIRSIPAIVILADGKETKRFVGVQSYQRLARELSRFKIKAGSE